jgi:hypothetical protein
LLPLAYNPPEGGNHAIFTRHGTAKPRKIISSESYRLMSNHAQDQKTLQGASHLETMDYEEGNKMGTHDTEVAQYIDPTIVISEEENKRLRKIIYRR